MHEVFYISAKQNLREARTRFNNARECYEALECKTSEYALAVKALMDNHEEVMSIWQNSKN